MAIDAQGNRATSVFDLAGNLTGTVDSRGNLTQYLIDPLGRASVTIDANGNRTTSLFDAVGNLTGSLDSNNNNLTVSKRGRARLLLGVFPPR